MPAVPAYPVCAVVACEVCLKEIPRDVATTGEAAGYVHYFCGDSCFETWREGPDAPVDEPPKQR